MNEYSEPDDVESYSIEPENEESREVHIALRTDSTIVIEAIAPGTGTVQDGDGVSRYYGSASVVLDLDEARELHARLGHLIYLCEYAGMDS